MPTLRPGAKFGWLTVVRELPGGDHYTLWECKCVCGEVRQVRGANLVTRNTKSCGCFRRKHSRERALKHGKRRAPEYKVWVEMRYRCLKENHLQYPDYGGRGIKVCERWLRSFANFYEDMGERPTKKHSIGRIDNDGNYSPENCRWELIDQQANNRRNNVRLTCGGRTMTLIQWSRISGIGPTTIRNRIKRGWRVEHAIFQPTRSRSPSETQ